MLKTERINLKKFQKRDIDLLFQLDGDSDVMRFITLGVPSTREEIIKNSMPRIQKSYKENKNFGIFAAYLNNPKDYIGWFQFQKDYEINNAIEIGWRLRKKYWGHGYASEVALALTNKGAL